MRLRVFILLFPLCLNASGSEEAARSFWQQQRFDHPLVNRGEVLFELGNLKNLDWEAKGPHSLVKGLVGLSLVPRGRDAVAKLLELKQLKVLATIPPDAVEGGLYEKGTLFLDGRAPFLAFIVALFHESLHAIDDLSPAAIRLSLIEGEHRAYRAQDSLLYEYLSLNRNLERVIDDLVLRRKIIAFPISEANFRYIMEKGFQLEASAIEAHLKAQPY